MMRGRAHGGAISTNAAVNPPILRTCLIARRSMLHIVTWGTRC